MYFELSYKPNFIQINIQAGSFYITKIFFLAYHILKHLLHNLSYAPGNKHHLHIYLFELLVSIFSAVRTIAGAVWLYIF